MGLEAGQSQCLIPHLCASTQCSVQALEGAITAQSPGKVSLAQRKEIVGIIAEGRPL